MIDLPLDFLHFESFCQGEAARGSTDLAEMMKEYCTIYPEFRAHLMRALIDDQPKFLQLRMELREYQRGLKAQPVVEKEMDHHRDAPAPSWREAVTNGLQDPKDHSR